MCFVVWPGDADALVTATRRGTGAVSESVQVEIQTTLAAPHWPSRVLLCHGRAQGLPCLPWGTSAVLSVPRRVKPLLSGRQNGGICLQKLLFGISIPSDAPVPLPLNSLRPAAPRGRDVLTIAGPASASLGMLKNRGVLWRVLLNLTRVDGLHSFHDFISGVATFFSFSSSCLPCRPVPSHNCLGFEVAPQVRPKGREPDHRRAFLCLCTHDASKGCSG